MSKRAALVPVMLLAGVVAAVVGATAALRLVGGGAFGPGGQPLSPADVQHSLAQQSSAGQNLTTGPASTPGPAATTGPARFGFVSSGGTVYATCLSGQVWLAIWSPAQSYRTDNVARGPAASAWVSFKSGPAEVTVTAKCAGGRPDFTTASDNAGGAAGGGGGGAGGEVGDDHGGGGGGGGSGGGPGGGGGPWIRFRAWRTVTA